MLKQLLGQVGHRLNMRQSSFTKVEANLFFQLFPDPMKQPLNFHILTNDMIQIEWIYKQDCQPEDNKTYYNYIHHLLGQTQTLQCARKAG